MLAKKVFHQPLIWVKPELESTIKSARNILEKLSDELNNPELLEKLRYELHLLKGSLEILEFNGAALLIEDMQKACNALEKKTCKNEEETFEAILDATLALESYIDKLHKDQTDIPVALLPILNDIRASIEEPLLSESALFLPNLSIVPKTPGDVSDNEKKESRLNDAAKSLRPYYQAALLSWYRNPSDKLSIQQMKLVARNLESACYTPRNRQIWWIMGGLFEALADQGLQSNISIRLLLGQADRILKSFANNDLSYYEKNPPFNLLKNALYYISQANSEGERVNTLKQVYQLDIVMPSEKDLSELREQLKGPNTDALHSIAKELRKILAQSKATIENFMRNSPTKIDRLLQTIIPLKHVADTLSILSLSKEKQLLQEQIIKIRGIIEAKQQPDKESMIPIASAIIQIESGLQHIGSPYRRASDKSLLNLEEESIMNNERKSATGQLPETEFRYLATKAVSEAKSNITEVKNSLLSFISTNCTNFSTLQEIPELLSEIKGCLRILNDHFAADIISAFMECIIVDILNKEESKLEIDFDLLAETLVSIDYYLEAVSEERSSTEQLLYLAKDCLEKLGYPVEAPKPEAKIPTLEAVVTHITEAPTRIRINANALSDIDSEISSKEVASDFQFSGFDSNTNVVEFTPEVPDDEVAEIFIEEAQEELGKLETQLKTLQLDISDKETLSNIHRIYHTLKGSGKIAGAIHISDFSSTIEEYLNRVLFGAIKISDEGVSLLNDANSLINELIDCFQKRVTPPQLFNTLTETAIGLMAPKTPPKPLITIGHQQISKKPSRPDTSASAPTENKPELSNQEIEDLLQEAYTQLAIMDKYIESKNENNNIAPIPQFITEAILKLHKCAQQTTVKEFVQTTDLLSKYIDNLTKKSAPVNSETIGILSEFSTTSREILSELPGSLNASDIDIEKLSTPEVTLPVTNDIEPEETIRLPSTFANFDVDSKKEVQTDFSLENELALLNPSIEEISQSNELETVDELTTELAASGQEETTYRQAEPEISEDDLDLMNIFIEEAEELIARGNGIINENDLSQVSQTDNDLLTSIQRILHTMKGSARMAGASSVANISHSFENLAEAIIVKQIDYPQNFEILFQETLDAINDMIDDIRSGDDVRLHEELVEKLENTLNPSSESQESITTSVAPEHFKLIEDKEKSADNTIVDSTSSVESFEQGTDTDAQEITLPEEDKPLSTEIAAFDNVTPIQQFYKPKAADVETLHPDIENEEAKEVETKTHLEEAVEKTKEESPVKKSESLKVNADLIDQIVDLANSEGSINNRLEDHIATTKTNLLELDKAISRALSQMRDLQFNTSRNHEISQQLSIDNTLNLSQFSETQKIALRMMESVGDIENLHSIITKLTLETDNLIQQQKRAHSSMYENLLNTRLVSFSIQSQRMQRIVRQTCQALDKKAELQLEGTDGSIDRVLLETIMSPIEHIIRNGIAHGIEKPDIRKAATKDETGKLIIKFRKEQSHHVIEIQDDGAGIDPEAVKQKALEKGIIKSATGLADEEIIQLIFKPGFSTSQSVDQISGRGVGMNVVLTEIESLGGSVSVDSAKGQGSTFAIRLPFTVSRHRTLLVRANTTIYAIPTNSVVQTIPISQAKLESLYADPNPTFEFEEQDYSLWHIESLLNKEAVTLPNKYQNAYLLILKFQHKRLAIQVDEIIEARDSVLKSANPQLADIKGLAGTTILGNGKVVLILDIPSLFSLADEQTSRPNRLIYPKEEIIDNESISALIVDDSITVRKVSERFLNRNTVSTKTARDGLEALEVLKEYTPDVILLDIEMPNMDGLELAKRVKADENMGAIPIIMITSRTGQQHRQAASEIGVDVFLSKPYQESELLGYIQALTGKRLRNA